MSEIENQPTLETVEGQTPEENVENVENTDREINNITS